MKLEPLAILLGVLLVVSVGVNLYLANYLNKSKDTISRAMGIMANNSVESRQATNKAEELDQVVSQISDKVIMANPEVQGLMGLVQLFAPDLELDPQTIMYLMNNPTVKQMLAQWMPQGGSPPARPPAGGSSRYRFRDGLMK